MEENDRSLKKKARQRQIRRRVTLILLLLVTAACGIFAYIRFAPETRRMEPEAWFEMSLGREPEENELAVVLQDQVSDETARLVDGELYLPYSMVRGTLFSRYFLDEENAVILFTTADTTYTFTPDSCTVVTDGGETEETEHPVVIRQGETLYILASHMQEHVNVRVNQYPEEYRVLIDYRWGERPEAEVKKKTAVRASGGIKSLILTKVEAGETVGVLEQYDKWSRVVTQNGFIGYVRNRSLQEVSQQPFENDFEEPVYASISLGEKVSLVWHQIDIPEANDYLVQDTAEMTGVNVISPTWFSLSDNEGNFTSFASKSYVKKAHKAGLQVWGLVSNFSEDMSTRVLVSSTAARLNLANNLVNEALKYKLDGINVDLEAITEDSAYGYVQFVRELSVLCRKNGLILSVDVPVQFDFNLYYDRTELGRFADYVIVMGYDEHYYGSEAGSVASLSFEEQGLTTLLGNVPAEKIVSGIPFYTRMWYSQTDENGEESVWSEVLGMNAVTRTLETYGVTPVWDEETGQNYAEWTLDDGIVCRIWVEDEESITRKVSLVSRYGVGGVAAWVLGFERSSIWNIISEGLSQ